MAIENINKVIALLLIITGIFIISSCGDEEMKVDEVEEELCDSVEFIGEDIEFNDLTYSLSESTYSDALILNHNFRFKAFSEDCIESLEVALNFSHSISFPDFSLAGSYTTKFSINAIELDLEEMTGTFKFSDSGTQYIVSGGTATITEVDDSNYLITVDSPTSSLTGSTTDMMKLSVTVPK